MNDILPITRDQLACAVAQHIAPLPDPLTISPWVAMSLLQKGIRRAEEHHALRAAATLLRDAPERLWRRLGCIAWEDIGLGDLDTVFLVTAALAGKTFRASLGGEWAVGSYLVTRMATSPKCRAADDLLMSAELHPSLKQARLDLANENTRELLRVSISTAPLPFRALALWYALGTRLTKNLQARRGDSQTAFDHLCEAGYPHTVVEMAREAHRKTGEPLAAFVALLAASKLQEPGTILDDELPPEIMIGDVPGWGYDIYTREGRAALARFVEGSSETASWIREHLPASERVVFLGGIVFRIEGQLCRARVRWPVADALRAAVDLQSCADLRALELIKQDLQYLEICRLVNCRSDRGS